MVEITERKVRESFELYCTEMKINKESWSAIFDYSSTIGFSVINGIMTSMDDSTVEVTPSTARAIEWLTGPHAVTMAKILKSKRLSRAGRIKAVLLKCGHAVWFAMASIYQVFRAILK